MNQDYLQAMLYESDSTPNGLPDGVVFWEESESRKLDTIIDSISALYKNYHKVIPPVFEYYETFEKASGLPIARKSFSFKDKDGKMLSLRFDMTTPIARMVSMKYQADQKPLRFYYVGDVFREQPLHRGKLRQLRQLGIEYIGDDSADADLEVLSLFGESLAKIKSDFTVVVGNVELFGYILSMLKPHCDQEALHAAFNRKDVVSLSQILQRFDGEAKYKELLLELPYLNGHRETIGNKIKAYCKNDDLIYNKYIKKLLDLVESLDQQIAERVIIDFGLVKEFSYYSSLTMEGYVDGIGFPVANGGRYNGLFKAFERDIPAVGFAVDVGYCL